MDGFDKCISYLQHMLLTSLSSVWSHLAWKAAVHAVLLIQKIAEVLFHLEIATRQKP